MSEPAPTPRARAAWTAGALLLIAAAYLAALAGSDFAVRHNDFWGTLGLARRFQFSDPATWHSGFYPVGHTLFLKCLAPFGGATAAALVNVLLMLGGLAAVAGMVAPLARPVWLAGALVAGVAAIPKFFFYASQPGPDIGCAAWVAIGAALLHRASGREGSREAARWALAGGCVLGLAALWRYHALALGPGLAAGFALVARRPAAVLARGLAGFLLVYALQVGLNLGSGHGAFETLAPALAHKAMYGLSWSDIGTSSDFTGSMLDVFRLSRAHFVLSWLRHFAEHLPVLALFALAALRRPESPLSRASLAILAGLLAFFALASLGRSDRTALAVLPLVPVAVAALLQPGAETARPGRTGRLAAAAAALLALVWLQDAVRENVHQYRWRARFGRAIAALDELVRREIRPESSLALCSNDYDVYFPGVPGLTPWRYGGWSRYGTGDNRGRLPDPALPWPEYKRGLQRAGIRGLVLSTRWDHVAPALRSLHRGEIRDPDVRVAGTVDWFTLCTLAPGPETPASPAP